MGVHPFTSAKKGDRYFNLLQNKASQEQFWQVTGADGTSDEFKDLFTKMCDTNPNNRPTLKEI